MGVTELDEQRRRSTLGTVLKYREDHDRVEQHGFADIVKQALARGRTLTAWAVAAQPTSVTAMAVAFARVLRGAGLLVPTSTVIAFAEALGAVGVERRDDVYWAARATLVRRPEDLRLFDRAFRVFWEHGEPTGGDGRRTGADGGDAGRRQ